MSKYLFSLQNLLYCFTPCTEIKTFSNVNGKLTHLMKTSVNVGA